MRKIISLLGTFWAVSCLLTSCLENETVELSPNASIASFSINDITTTIKTQTSDGRDTTTKVTVDGDLYPFAIDHVNGLVYNVDSLPQGTDVSAVTVNLGVNGGYALYGEEPKVYASEDSIDFTRPVKFSIVAADGEGARNYYISINVHQTNVDSLMWQAIESNFPCRQMTAEKAVVLDKTLIVFGETPDGAAYTVSSTDDAAHWTAPALMAVQGSVDFASITSYNGILYLLADGKLFSSTDKCVSWVAEVPERTFTTMIGAVDGELHLLEGSCIVSTPFADAVLEGATLTQGWDTLQTVDVTTFPMAPWAITVPLPSNPYVNRTTLVGVPKDYAGNTVSVWAKLSTEARWTAYEKIASNKDECPLLERLTVISYANSMYAFGGASVDGELEAFEAVYVSTDGGITWQKRTKNIGLPVQLRGNDQPFASLVDNDHRIWIIPNDGGNLYRGYLAGQGL